MWRLEADIQLLETDRELPQLDEDLIQEFSDALLEAALCIVKRKSRGNGRDSEIGVSCRMENC